MIEENPICFICKTKVCACLKSIPEDKRLCNKCRTELRNKNNA